MLEAAQVVLVPEDLQELGGPLSPLSVFARLLPLVPGDELRRVGHLPAGISQAVEKVDVLGQFQVLVPADLPGHLGPEDPPVKNHVAAPPADAGGGPHRPAGGNGPQGLALGDDLPPEVAGVVLHLPIGLEAAADHPHRGGLADHPQGRLQVGPVVKHEVLLRKDEELGRAGRGQGVPAGRESTIPGHVNQLDV